ncbi:MAG: UrcA family protein [Steroidobacteraceae bacterium]
MRKLLQAQAIALLAAVAVSGSAVGQETEEVTVRGPGIQTTEVERSATGVPVVMFTVSYKVSYEDLDLTTTEGMAELTKRIEDAAKQGCREIGLAYRTAQPSDWLCARHATREAMAEVEQLAAVR